MKAIFLRGGIPPKAYQTILTREFGPEWLTWLPETLYTEIQRVWGVRPNEEVSDKINALRTVLTTDLLYHDATAFEHIILAMNDTAIDPSTLSLCSPDELIYGLYVLGPLDSNKFEREIVAYIRACCENVGLLVYPANLKFAQPEYKSKELKLALSQIKAKLSDGPQDNLVVQQSNKLYKYVQDAVDRIAKFRPELLEDAT